MIEAVKNIQQQISAVKKQQEDSDKKLELLIEKLNSFFNKKKATKLLNNKLIDKKGRVT